MGDELPACETVLDIIGDLFAHGRQLKHLVFDDRIVSLLGKLPILGCFVPEIVCPFHVVLSNEPGSDSERMARLPIKKGDRLPVPAPTPLAVTAAQSEVVPPLALPREWLPLATEDDIRQAEAEHHRHSDICRHGRTYFTIQHHQYWRCKV